MQDFGAMCQERDTEEVKGVLPYWPRIYCKISVVSCSFALHPHNYPFSIVTLHAVVRDEPVNWAEIRVGCFPLFSSDQWVVLNKFM